MKKYFKFTAMSIIITTLVFFINISSYASNNSQNSNNNNSTYSSNQNSNNNTYSSSKSSAPKWTFEPNDTKGDDFSYIQENSANNSNSLPEVDWLRYLGIACIVIAIVCLLYTFLIIISLSSKKRKYAQRSKRKTNRNTSR